MTTITTERKKLSYFREVQNELKKVTWTSRQELLFCTKAVIFAIFIFGFAIYGVDFVIRSGLNILGMVFRALFG